MTPRVLAAELIRFVNERDADGAEALFAPSAELLFPRFAPRTVYRGGRELREFFSWLGEVLPQQVFAAARIVADHRSATVEFETAGVSRKGHDFDGSGALVIDVAAGLIAGIRVYIDTADLGRILEVA